MIRQDFALPSWDWNVTVFYECDSTDWGEVICSLDDCGCDENKMRSIKGVVFNGNWNCGATYSNRRYRQSVMIIGRTTNAKEFINSYDHEKGHLCKQICQALHINPWGEEAEYLAGEVGMKTFPYAKHFLCDCCRKRHLS